MKIFVNFNVDMKAVEIKTELKDLIENETDLNVLEAIKTLLQRTPSSSLLKDKLTLRAMKAQEDIKEGRVLNRADIDKKLNARFGL